MESAFKKNITEQVDRLLSQLEDLETFKDDPDMTKEDFEELKQETEAQLKEFEKFLESAMKQESDQASAKEAHDRIESAKSKIFGVSAAMAVLESGEAESIRQRLVKILADFNLKKISETDL